jgi:hypothetical protein
MLRANWFCTNLFTSDYYRFPKYPYSGRGWRVYLARAYGAPPFDSELYQGRTYHAKVVVIRAGGTARVIAALNLVHASMLALHGSDPISVVLPGWTPRLHPTTRIGRDWPDKDTASFLKGNRRCEGHIPLACLIACRAAHRLETVYALEKLRLSLETFSLHFVDLDPSHTGYLRRSSIPRDHVCFSNAVLLAHACIEELGLEVRASHNKPS